MSELGRLKVGMFMAPYHQPHESPTLAFERDLELIEWMDDLGYDNCFVGEHHSGGWETIADPCIFVAAAAERTKNITLGTGVLSLPYHHPLMVAERVNQLDHMTRGRFVLGVGPGGLVNDAYMMGIPAEVQRERMYDALNVIMRLLRGETVTSKTDWYELNEGRTQLLPYSEPHVKVFVTSLISPSGLILAGREGIGVLSLPNLVAAPPKPLDEWWPICEEEAEKNGKQVDRSNWWMGCPLYIAETREKAFEDVRAGANAFYKGYLHDTLGGPLGGEDGVDELDAAIARKGCIVGTPDDAIEQIQDMQKRSGGFGGFLHGYQEWTTRENILKSHELFSRYVMPELHGHSDFIRKSGDWVRLRQEAIFGTQPEIMRKEYEKAGQEVPEAFVTADEG